MEWWNDHVYCFARGSYDPQLSRHQHSVSLQFVALKCTFNAPSYGGKPLHTFSVYSFGFASATLLGQLLQMDALLLTVTGILVVYVHAELFGNFSYSKLQCSHINGELIRTIESFSKNL